MLAINIFCKLQVRRKKYLEFTMVASYKNVQNY